MDKSRQRSDPLPPPPLPGNACILGTNGPTTPPLLIHFPQINLTLTLPICQYCNIRCSIQPVADGGGPEVVGGAGEGSGAPEEVFYISQDENMSKDVDDPIISDDKDHLDLHMFKCHRI